MDEEGRHRARRAGQAGREALFCEDARFNITKARDADVYVYTRQTSTEFPNYCVSNAGLQGRMPDHRRNPQQKDLAWSSGARLVDYMSDKGDKLQGALYLPANYEPGKKYPMLVTIYEKRSQNLNVFVNPNETRAPNPTIYTSRGYAVFDPDIVYTSTIPACRRCGAWFRP